MAPPKRPFSILVAIHTPELRVLLLHRRAPSCFWQSVTGSLEIGETPRDTAVREVFEETGLAIAANDLRDWKLQNRFLIPPAWSARYGPGVTFNTENVFSLCIPEGAPIRLATEEHDAMGWFEVDEAVARSWSWTNRDILYLLREASRA